MCIVYFACYQHCDHNSILGIFNCGLNCPTGTRHTFTVEDPSGPCQTCDFINDEELDPDIAPVTFYAPTHEADTLRFHHAHLENIGREASKHRINNHQEADNQVASDYDPTMGSLSDPDSLTSEWRLGPSWSSPYPDPSQSHIYTADYPYQYTYPSHGPHTSAPDSGQVEHPPSHVQAGGQDVAPDMTPRTAAHRTLVRDQLKNLPTRLEAQKGQLQTMEEFYVPGGYTAEGKGGTTSDEHRRGNGV
ncbi:hypothetical protein FB567DRAFT_591411 [Paraphoma chrysanthemicola]|uniref:Uncharacterized protein n=1 Tax=Paraphoma chrysanthemicola TaxID=798071 RepID=A0A8K0R9E8_9PLEO|nr:hypothetical protein FB567DRAFT_591411 [Paraphoma chrysanthemicola]